MRDDESIEDMKREFRRHVEAFYARLQLAPPYHSVENAIAELAAALRTLPADQRARLATDVDARWGQFTRAFAASGLPQKHRGIIIGLIRAGRAPGEYRAWLDLYLSAPDASPARADRSS